MGIKDWGLGFRGYGFEVGDYHVKVFQYGEQEEVFPQLNGGYKTPLILSLIPNLTSIYLPLKIN